MYKDLFKVKLFWVALLLPIFVSIFMGIGMSVFGNYEWSGFNNLTQTFQNLQFPLYFFALSFPAVAIVVAQHRSKMMLAQFSEIQNNNKLTNFLKHREEFTKLLSDVDNVDINSLHKVVFGSFESFKTDIQPSFLLEFNKRHIAFINSLWKLNYLHRDVSKSVELLSKCFYRYRVLCELIYMKSVHGDNIGKRIEKAPFFYYTFSSSSEMQNAIQRLTEVLFSIDSLSSTEINTFAEKYKYNIYNLIEVPAMTIFNKNGKINEGFINLMIDIHLAAISYSELSN